MLFILTPTVFQMVYTVLRIKNKTRLSIGVIFLLALVLGFILPIAATFISMFGLSTGSNPGELQCINGIQFFAFFGIGSTIVLAPIIGLTGALLHYVKNKKQNNPPLPDN